MARADILSALYSRKTTALDFNYDSLIAPPMYTLIPNADLEKMYKLVTSVKYNSKIDYKEAEIKKIMEYHGFIRFASGTHRVVYRHLDYPYIVAKISLNKSSLMDNIREFHNQSFLKPFCCKCFEVDQSGMIGLFEKVDPILSREEFLSIAGDIFDFINEKILGKYIVDDIGTESFMNYGLRKGFGPVLIDYPEVYVLDGNKLYCNRFDHNTGLFCGGLIDMDDGFNNIRCQKCGRHYDARELQLLEKNNEVIKKGVSTNMKMEIKRGDTIIKTVDSSKMPTDHIEPPTKKRTSSSNQMSIINNPRPRGRVKKSSNCPATRNAGTASTNTVSTGIGLNSLSHPENMKSAFPNPKASPCHVVETNDAAVNEPLPPVEEAPTEEKIYTPPVENDSYGFYYREYATEEANASDIKDIEAEEEEAREREEYNEKECCIDKKDFIPMYAGPCPQYSFNFKQVHAKESEDEIPSESSVAYKDKEGENFNNAFRDKLMELNKEPENEASAEEESSDNAEDELGGEATEDPSEELGATAETTNYNTDTGFIPSAAEVGGEVKSNPFAAIR